MTGPVVLHKMSCFNRDHLPGHSPVGEHFLMIGLKHHHGAHARGREHRDLLPVRSVDELVSRHLFLRQTFETPPTGGGARSPYRISVNRPRSKRRRTEQIAQSISSAVITSGGAKRSVEPWVSLTSTPRSASRRLICLPVPSDGSMSTPGPQSEPAHREHAVAGQRSQAGMESLAEFG